MKQILNQNTAIITFNGVSTVAEKCTIFTEDSASVDLLGDVPDLPESGQLVIGMAYRFDGDIYKVRQTHNRTIYPPKTTPALFTYYRVNSENLDWYTGEQVEVGWVRSYEGKDYQCVQAHVTQSDWTPPLVPALWTSTDQRPSQISEWAAGIAYKVGDKCTYQGATYEVIQAHTSQAGWTPPIVPALFKKL